MVIYGLFGLLSSASFLIYLHGRNRLGKACIQTNNYKMLVEKKLCGYRQTANLESSSFFGVVNEIRFNDMAFRWFHSSEDTYRFALMLAGKYQYYTILQYSSPKHPYIYRLYRDDAPGLDSYLNIDELQEGLYALLVSEDWEEM